MRKRLNQISFLSVYAMILVVIGHSDITLDYKELWIFKWIYTFHMPLFFLISGFLFVYTNPEEKMKKMSPRQFVVNKMERLLLPFIFINSIIFVTKALIANKEQMQHPISFSFPSYVDSMLFHPIGYMWFLPALFVIFMLFILLKRSIYSKYFPVITIVLFILNFVVPEISFFKISDAIHFSGYFALGILYCQYKKCIDEFLLKYRYVALPFFFILSAILIDNKLIAALVGIAFSLVLSLVFEHRCGEGIIKLSGYTYTIFLLSYFPQMFIRGPIAHAFPGINQYILSVVSALVGFFIPVLIGEIVMRIRLKNKVTKFAACLIGLR